jgi:peptidoglycan/LPS O-acetylase OafA/YrhL
MAAGRIDPQALSAGVSGGGYNAGINGLRGLCVAAVFAFHVASSGLPPAPDAASAWQLAAAYATGCLAHGVEVFFMISGYVIVQSLQRHATIRGFLVDRGLRILPLWVPMVLLIGVAGPWLGWRAVQQLDLANWLRIVGANVLLLPPLLPLPMLHPASWSLTVEWLFYGAAAGVMALWRSHGMPRGLRMAVALAVLALAAWLLPVALCFGIGVFVALWPPLALWTRSRPWLAAPALLAFLLLWHGLDGAGLDSGAMLPTLLARGQGPALLLALAAGSVGLAGLCAPGTRALPSLHAAWLQRLGTISYSFYLWHLLVMFAVKRGVLRLWPDGAGHWGPALVFAALSLALSWWVSALSWRWVEQAFGRRLRAAWFALGSTRRASAAQAP